MGEGQIKGKQNRVFCLQKSPQRNKTIANSTAGTCVFFSYWQQPRKTEREEREKKKKERESV